MAELLPTDLVERIREHEGAYLFPKTADALLKEAADEIERLRICRYEHKSDPACPYVPQSSNLRNIPAERLEDAARIIMDFARENPIWHDRERGPQDPYGAHAWLDWYRSGAHETPADPDDPPDSTQMFAELVRDANAWRTLQAETTDESRDLWVAWSDEGGGWIAAIHGARKTCEDISDAISREINEHGRNRFFLRPVRITAHIGAQKTSPEGSL